MPKPLSPEEVKIIRQTEREGAELAEREERETGKKPGAGRAVMNAAVFAFIFFLIAFLAYLVFHP